MTKNEALGLVFPRRKSLNHGAIVATEDLDEHDEEDIYITEECGSSHVVAEKPAQSRERRRSLWWFAEVVLS
ncbi:hypothetical protein Bca4012_032032 [Brassica carinata]